MNEEKIYPSMVIRSQAEAIELLENENKQLQNNWNGLKIRLQEWKKFLEKCDKELILSSYKKEISILEVVLDDMQELEQGKDENN